MTSTQLEELISAQEIQKKVAEIGTQIDQQYQGTALTIICIMKGAVCFVADLIRNIKIPCTIDFIQASSYGARGTTRGELTVVGLEQLDVKAKNILLIDDICDSGATLLEVSQQIKLKNPRSLKTLALLCKKVPKVSGYTPDFCLFEVEDLFVVGYGLDYKEFYRGLPNICVLKNLFQAS